MTTQLRKNNFKYTVTNRQIFVSLGIAVFALAVVIIAVQVARNYGKNNGSNNVTIESIKENTLPPGWKKVESLDKNVLVRYEKDSTTKVKPVLVVASSQIKVDKASAYVDKLIKGAKSTLPSLRYTSDKDTSVDGEYSRTLEGYYTNSGNKVRIYQKVIIKSGTVYTITISYSENDVTPSEIEELVKSASTTNL